MTYGINISKYVINNTELILSNTQARYTDDRWRKLRYIYIYSPSKLPSTTAAKITKVSSKDKSTSRKRRRDESSSADTIKQLKRQATQRDKITIMLHSIQKDMKSTKGQSRIINQLQSQIKQLRTQMSQIQKNIAEKLYYIYYFIKKKDAKT